MYMGLYSSFILLRDDYIEMGSGAGPNIAADDWILGASYYDGSF